MADQSYFSDDDVISALDKSYKLRNELAAKAGKPNETQDKNLEVGFGDVVATPVGSFLSSVGTGIKEAGLGDLSRATRKVADGSFAKNVVDGAVSGVTGKSSDELSKTGLLTDALGLDGVSFIGVDPSKNPVKEAASTFLNKAADVGEYAADKIDEYAPIKPVAGVVGGGIKAVGDGISDLRSDDAKEASGSSVYTRDDAGDFHLGNIWSDPARASIKLLDTIGTFGGVVASGMLTGGAVKSMVTRTMLKRGASEAIAKQTAELAAKKWSERAVAGSAMGISVGGAADNARDEYDQLSDSDKLNSPTFGDTVKSVYEQHPELSSSQRMAIVDEQMREKRASYVKSDPATYAAAAAGTMLGDSALFKMVTGRAGASEVTGGLLSRATQGFAKGGLGEGVGEAVEDGTQRNVLNRASNAIDNTNIDPMKGVLLSALESGTLGFATGGGIGAGSAIAHGSSKPAQPSEAPEQQSSDSANKTNNTSPEQQVNRKLWEGETGKSYPETQNVTEHESGPSYLRSANNEELLNELAYANGEAERAAAKPITVTGNPDEPAFLRTQQNNPTGRNTEDLRDANPYSSVQEALSRGSDAYSPEDLVAQSQGMGNQGKTPQEDFLTGEIMWDNNGDPVPQSHRLDQGATVDGYGREVRQDSQGLSYNNTINMPGDGGNGVNDNYVPPVTADRTSADKSLGVESTRDPRSPLAQSIEQAGSESASIFDQLKTVRVTKRGKPFGSEKEAQLASRKTETPIELPTGGFGVVNKVELEQAKNKASQRVEKISDEDHARIVNEIYPGVDPRTIPKPSLNPVVEDKVGQAQSNINQLSDGSDTDVAGMQSSNQQAIAPTIDVNGSPSNGVVAQNQPDINVNEQPVSQATVKQVTNKSSVTAHDLAIDFADNGVIADASRDDNEHAYGKLQNAVSEGLLTSNQAGAIVKRSMEVAKANRDRSIAGDYINEAVKRMRGGRVGSNATASTIELYERGNRVGVNNAGKYDPEDAVSQLGKPVITEEQKTESNIQSKISQATVKQSVADIPSPSPDSVGVVMPDGSETTVGELSRQNEQQNTAASTGNEQANVKQDAPVIAKPDLPWTEYKDKPDGTMLLKGDTEQLSEWAKANNVLTIKSKSGVIVGKKSAPIVKDIIAKHSDETVAPETSTQEAPLQPMTVKPWNNVIDKADGTIVMEGNPAQLKEWAKQNNITAIKSKTGIVVGKNSVPAVKDIIAKSNAPTNAQQNEAVPTEILPSQPTEIITPPQLAEAKGSIPTASVPWTNSIDKPDGTMILEGDPIALNAWAKENDITAIKSKTGVVVGKSSVPTVKDFISKQQAPSNDEVQTVGPTLGDNESQLTSQPVLKSKSAGNSNKSGISKEEVDRVVEEFKREYKGNIPPEIITRQTQEEAYGPEATIDRVGKIEGGYLPAGNKLHIIADNISTKRDRVFGNSKLSPQGPLNSNDAIRRVLRHEILGHYGLNTFSPEEKRSLIGKIKQTRSDSDFSEAWRHIDKNYPDSSESRKAEEVFAHIAEEKHGIASNTWNRVLSSLHGVMRRNGMLNKDVTIHELREYARSIAKGIKSGERKQQIFPTDNESQYRKTDTEAADKGGFSLSTIPKNEAEISGKGMTKPEAHGVAKQWLRQFKTDINVEVVKDQAEFESALADRGFANSIQSGEMDNAAYLPDSKTILINSSAIQNPKRLKQIMRHEILVHHGLRYVVGENAYVKIMNAIAKGYETSPAIRSAVDTVTKNYADKDMLTQMEEAFAHYAENSPADSGPIGRLWQRITGMVKSALQKVNFVSVNESEQQLDSVLHAIARNMRQGIEDGVLASKAENVMFSHDSKADPFKPNKEDVDNYRAQLEKAMRSQRSGEIMIDIGSTSEVLKAVGAPDLVLRISRDTIRKAVNGVKHDVPMNVIEKLPELLHDPISVFDSKTHPGDSLVVLLDATDKSGRSVVSAIQLKVVAGKYLDINRIASIHGRPEAQINQWLSDGLTRYIKENHPNSLRTGLQLPLGSSMGGHDFSVLTDADIRKRSDVMFSRSSPTDDALMNKLGLGPKQDVIDKTKERINNLKQTDRAQVKSWIDETTKKANTQILDYLAPIKYAEDKTGRLDASESGYVAARLATGSATVMNATMLHGLPAWKDGVIQRKDGTGEADSLLGIFESLGSDLHNWLGWMAGHRAERLLAEGRENLLTTEDIAALKDKGAGKEAKFEEARKKWNALNKSVLDLAEEAGLFTAEDRSAWDSEWYVPFFREMEDGDVTGPYKHKGIANQTAGIKKLKGGTANVNDILQNIFTTTSKTIDAAMKNMAAQKVVHNLVETDLITVLEKPNLMEIQAASKNQGNKLLVKIEGENYVIQINDEPLFNAMTMIDQKIERGAIRRTAIKAKHLLTAGTTSAPSFMARNFIRDAASTWVINEDGFKPMIDSVRGVIKSWNMDESSINMMFSGASFMGGNLRGNDPEVMASAVRKALRRKGMSPEQIDQYEKTIIRTGKKAMDFLGKYWEQYERAGEAIENGSREAVYEAAIKAGKTHAQAAFEAKDLMDFSMHGASKAMQLLVDILPFFNARMQGLGKLGRAIKANPKQIARRGGMIAGVSLALLALNWDDERYEDLPDWDKDMNWHIWFGDQHVRIPKPFEIGLMFGTLPERMARAIGGKDTVGKFGKIVALHMLNTLAINPIPQVIRPLVEDIVNYDFFRGAQIDNMSDQNRLPEARYDERTSLLMRELGDITGFSPKKLEHLVTGYIGTFGASVLGMADSMVRAVGDYGSAPAYRAEQIPLLGTFFQGSAPARSTQSMQDFYSLLRESNQVYSTIREYVEEGKTEDAEKLKNENIDTLRKRPILNRAQKQFNALRNEMELIERDKLLNADQKRERIDKLLKRRNDFAAKLIMKFERR